MIQLLALDIAGTTIEEGGAVYAALKSAAEAALGTQLSSAQLRPALGSNKREAITGFLMSVRGEADPEDVEQIYQDFRERLLERYEMEPPQALPGVAEALADLRAAGVQVALTTGFSRSVATTVLNAAGWSVGDGPEHTVDILVTADDVEHGRPSPEMIEYAMRVAQVTDPAQVLVAGDTEQDLAAGTRAGARYVLAVSTGAQSVDELAAFAHTHICDVRDIPTLLKTLNYNQLSPSSQLPSSLS